MPFITFEGIDFCGKSTQVELLKGYLLSRNEKVEVVREPGGTEISEMVRNILLDKRNYRMHMEAEMFLFSSARAQLVREKIIPWLQKGIYVISDRFHDSTIAYQGYGRGIDLEAIARINKFAIGEAIPDITFLIDIPVEESERRKKLKDFELDRIESSNNEFYEKVRHGYLEIAKEERRMVVIDGTKDIGYINAKIIENVLSIKKSA